MANVLDKSENFLLWLLVPHLHQCASPWTGCSLFLSHWFWSNCQVVFLLSAFVFLVEIINVVLSVIPFCERYLGQEGRCPSHVILKTHKFTLKNSVKNSQLLWSREECMCLLVVCACSMFHVRVWMSLFLEGRGRGDFGDWGCDVKGNAVIGRETKMLRSGSFHLQESATSLLSLFGAVCSGQWGQPRDGQESFGVSWQRKSTNITTIGRRKKVGLWAWQIPHLFLLESFQLQAWYAVAYWMYILNTAIRSSSGRSQESVLSCQLLSLLFNNLLWSDCQ